MVDLHCHLLPGIDDGARDLAESVEMGRVAWDDGIRTIVATPHRSWEQRVNSFERVKRLARDVEQTLKEEGVPLRIVPGTEMPTRAETQSLAREQALPTFGDGPWVLLEPPFGHLPVDMDRFVGDLIDMGYRLLLAHPERCHSIQENPEILDTFFPSNFPIQLTANSVTGEFGARPLEAAEALLGGSRPIVIASDGHSPGRRPPRLSVAMAIVGRLVGETRARKMVYDLPEALLRDLPLPAD